MMPCSVPAQISRTTKWSSISQLPTQHAIWVYRYMKWLTQLLLRQARWESINAESMTRQHVLSFLAYYGAQDWPVPETKATRVQVCTKRTLPEGSYVLCEDAIQYWDNGRFMSWNIFWWSGLYRELCAEKRKSTNCRGGKIKDIEWSSATEMKRTFTREMKPEHLRSNTASMWSQAAQK